MKFLRSLFGPARENVVPSGRSALPCWSCGCQNFVPDPAPRFALLLCRQCRATLKPNVILCDLSAPASECFGRRRRIDLLHETMDSLLRRDQGARLIGFASTLNEYSTGHALPEPSGPTLLAHALKVASMLEPLRSVLILAGCPQDCTLAAHLFMTLPGQLDIVYWGAPDPDLCAWLNRLAKGKGGSLTELAHTAATGGANPLAEIIVRILKQKPERPDPRFAV